MRHAQPLVSIIACALSFAGFTVAPVVAQDSPATPTAARVVGAEFVWETRGGPQPLNYPMDVTIDPAGNIWVVDMANSQFQIFSPNGEFLEAWGSEGSGPGEFDFFAGPIADETEYGGDVAFDDDGNIYVADLANSRVQKFAPDRSLIAVWGGPGTADGEFQRPWSLDVDDQGNVYVADYTRANVQVFAGDGTFLRTLAAPGSGPGDMTDVASVIVDPTGAIWVSNYPARLMRFSSEGALLDSFNAYGDGDGEFDIPNVSAADGDLIYVADVVNHRIQVVDSAGNFVAAWGREGDGPGEFSYPVGVALDGQGNAYVADIGNNRIQKFRLLPPLAAVTPPLL